MHTVTRFFWGRVAWSLLGFCLLGCGPEPGTPEYVLKKVREGHVVGGQNLELLTATHVDAMLAIVDDSKAPRISRLQMLEWATRMELPNAFGKLRKYIDDENPEIRILMIRWFAQLGDVRGGQLLIDRLEGEKEEAVRMNIISTLTRLGAQNREPDAALINGLVAKFEAQNSKLRKTWAVILGGWQGEAVLSTLQKALADPDEHLQTIAAQALAGPAVRPLKQMATIFEGMLDHRTAGVRTAGLVGLTNATYPGRIAAMNDCAEKPTLILLGELPGLYSLLEKFLVRTDISDEERTLAKALNECLAKHTKEYDTAQAVADKAS